MTFLTFLYEIWPKLSINYLLKFISYEKINIL